MKKVMRWVSRIVSFVLFLTLIFMAVVVISSKASGGEPQFLGYQLKTVLSGSMEPGIKTGSIIAVKPGGDMTSFKKGDVITFKAEGNKLITHRITDVVDNGEQVLYRTKGDNNKSEDLEPVMPQNVVAKYSGFTVPFVGYFIEFSKSKNGSLLLLVLPGLLLLGYSGFTIWRAFSQLENQAKLVATTPIEEVPPNK